MERAAHPRAKLKVLIFILQALRLICTLTGAVNHQSRSSINELTLRDLLSGLSSTYSSNLGSQIHAPLKAKNMYVLLMKPTADSDSFKRGQTHKSALAHSSSILRQRVLFPLTSGLGKRQSCASFIKQRCGYLRACVSVCLCATIFKNDVPLLMSSKTTCKADVAEWSSHSTVAGSQLCFSFTLLPSEETVACGQAHSRMLPL